MRRPAPVYAAYAIGILGWVTDWRVVDIPELSHLPLASRDYIFRRGADISAISVNDGRYDDVTKVVLDGETFSMTRYRADWLDPLRDDPTVEFVRFPNTSTTTSRTSKRSHDR